MIGISKSLTNESLEVILQALNLAHNKGLRVSNSSHLFSVLLESPNIAKILEYMTINIQKLNQLLSPIINNSSSPIHVKSDQVIFSSDLKVTLLRSYQIMKNIQTDNINLEELFISCLQYTEIGNVLKEMRIEIRELENLIISSKGGVSSNTSPKKSLIERFTINMEDSLKKKQLINRQSELSQLTRTLVRSNKNNAILIGEVGVGKSSIVNLLVQKSLSEESLDQFKNVSFLLFNTAGFTSSLAYRNLSEMIELFQDELQHMGDVVIYFKNFEFSLDEAIPEKTIILNLIKSLLSSDRIKVILSMSSSSYKSLISRDEVFVQNFEPIKIKEPSIELSTKILNESATQISQYHNVSINPSIISTTVKLSKRYIQDRFLPSKAIDLLDEASSKIVLENKKEVTIDDIKKIISDKTGIPLEKLTESEQQKLVNLEKILSKTVRGQDSAVHIVSEVVRRSRAGLKDPKKPIGSFLFLGPSGVGKTYLAKNLSKIIYDSEKAMLRLDMSEFGESHTVQRLIGSPPGYVGYEEGGQLTNPVWERPYSLILLDEIEKANPKVFDIFLQVLDDGRLTDGQGRTVDFKNTIIIATSNIASNEITDIMTRKTESLSGFEREKFYEEEILPLLKEHFRPEFINRFDEIVVFNPLHPEILKEIAVLQIKKIQNRLKDKKIKINISETKLQEYAQKSYKPSFGARPLIRILQEEVENVLARKILSGEVKEGDQVNL